MRLATASSAWGARHGFYLTFAVAAPQVGQQHGRFGQMALWRTSLERIQREFQAASSHDNRLSCYLIQVVALRQTQGDPGDPYELNRPPRVGDHGLLGASLEPGPIISDGYILVGEQVYLDAAGTPMLSPAGDPIAFDLGFRRDHRYYSSNPTAFANYECLGESAGQCLAGLQEASDAIWKNLPPQTRLASTPCELWTDALFELAWQCIPGVPLRATRKATWAGNHSLTLPINREFWPEIPAEIADPPEYWYSVIDDVFSTSVAAMDILLALPDDTQPIQPLTPGEQENRQKLFPKGVHKNPDIVDLVVRLDAAKGTDQKAIAVARSITGEPAENCPKAKKLLAHIRVLKKRRQVNL